MDRYPLYALLGELHAQVDALTEKAKIMRTPPEVKARIGRTIMAHRAKVAARARRNAALRQQGHGSPRPHQRHTPSGKVVQVEGHGIPSKQMGNGPVASHVRAARQQRPIGSRLTYVNPDKAVAQIRRAMRQKGQ